MIKKFNEFLNYINEEVGIRNLSKLVKGYKDSEIYFHLDGDGVISCLCMKYFLKTYYNVEMIDAHIIQYGGLEHAIEKPKPGSLPVLVDFAHSKAGANLVFSLDHHTSQSGAEPFKKAGGGYFKPARSNAETISGEISYSDILSSTDLLSARTIDSADFVKYEIKPEDVQRAIFEYDPNVSSKRNRFLLGFIVNRLILAFKNKRITVISLDGKRNYVNKNILECLCLDSNPSVYSIYSNMMHYINNSTSIEWNPSSKRYDREKKLATPSEITANLDKYIATRKSAKGLDYDPDYKILTQLGIGNVATSGTGGYDRYVTFKNFPEAEFLCTIYSEMNIDKAPSIGLLQISCNPFVEKRLKNIDLGEVAREAISHFKNRLEKIRIPIPSIKQINETDIARNRKKSGNGYNPIGFTFDDLKEYYKDCIYYLPNRESGDLKTVAKLDINDESNLIVQMLQECMEKEYSEWTEEEIKELSWVRIPVWDIIIINSGGHKSISNLMGFNYLWARKDLMQRLFDTENYGVVMKYVRGHLLELLKTKIDKSRNGKKVDYEKNDVVLKGAIMNENVEYYLNYNGKIKPVTKDKFIEIGTENNFQSKRYENGKKFTIDIQQNKIIGKIREK